MMTILPDPPANLADWLALIMLAGGVIAGARKWLVNPILKRLDDHAEDHDRGRELRALVIRQLAPNGHEWELPEELRDKPLRALVAKGIIVAKRTEAKVDAHDAFSREAVKLVNADREARGLEPLPPPPGGAH